MKNFQIVSLAIFGGLALFGVLVFSGAIPLGKKDENVARGSVSFWGTYGEVKVRSLLEDFNRKNKTFSVRYEEKDPATYERELLEAFASGKAPDLFFLPSDLAYDYRDKVYIVPYLGYPLANFQNNFAGAGEVFALRDGIIALPLVIDPLVMYYNRSILDSNGVIFPPVYWDDLLEMVPKLTKITEDKQVLQSTVALGQFSNIANAKYILSTFFLQSGNPIVQEQSNNFRAVLSEQKDLLGSVLSFYTDFSNPIKTSYSWNRSLPNSKDYFTAEKSAFYFGLSSEFGELVNKNPNLDLAVAPVPQIKGATNKATFALVQGVAVSAFTKNLDTALTASALLVNSEFTAEFAQTFNLVPAKRTLLTQRPTDAFLPIFYDSALFAKGWLDPSPDGSNEVFRIMVDDVLSNLVRPESSVSSTNGRLTNLLIR